MRVRILWTIECEHSRSSFVPKLDGKNIETNVFVQKYNMRSHIVAWHLCPLVLPRVMCCWGRRTKTKMCVAWQKMRCNTFGDYAG